MKIITYLWNMLIHPRKTSQALLVETKLRYSASLVLGMGLLMSLSFLSSHFQKNYPPPAQDLKV